VHCDKTVDQIWIQFWMVGQMGPGMRQVVGFGDLPLNRIYLWPQEVFIRKVE